MQVARKHEFVRINSAANESATPRSISRWMAAKSAPLRSVLRDEPARLWLRSPYPDLDWRKSLELIAEGEYRRVIGAVQAMAEGMTT